MKLTWQRHAVRLHHPFNTAHTPRGADTSRKEVLIVRIDHDGQTGWGEAAPVSYYQQSLDSAERVFTQAADMLGDDPFALDAILDPIRERFPDQPAAMAAIDAALHDLIGKRLNLPIWKLFGLEPARLPPTSFTIGIDDLDTISAKVREAGDYPILKVKLGTDDDEAILSVIRREAAHKPLRVDANCGWPPDRLADRCRMAARYGVEMIEQPTPRGEHDALTAVRTAGMPPLIADESCFGPEDILTCARYFDGINIKLCKCGGIRRAMRTIHTARAAGLKIMIGCMVETSVGIAAAAQLGPLVDYLDLDSHLLLANDPFEGPGGEAGRLTLNDRPGLGAVPR